MSQLTTQEAELQALCQETASSSSLKTVRRAGEGLLINWTARPAAGTGREAPKT